MFQCGRPRLPYLMLGISIMLLLVRCQMGVAEIITPGQVSIGYNDIISVYFSSVRGAIEE